ncbi:MAG: hypothetical protein K0R71_1457 [Bacillales bacterium]|jgi:hypothetical protein|nr:hypothetical protein [Bacillales bacterium]
MKNKNEKDSKKNKKTATDNQWAKSNLIEPSDTRPRQDGPGGN